MTTAQAALTALYLPIAAFALLHIVRYGYRLVLVIRGGDFDPSRHMLWAALLFLILADLFEQLVYGYGRVVPGLHPRLAMDAFVVSPGKILILAGMVAASDAYCRIVFRRSGLFWASAASLAMWAGAFWLLLATVVK